MTQPTPNPNYEKPDSFVMVLAGDLWRAWTDKDGYQIHTLSRARAIAKHLRVGHEKWDKIMVVKDAGER